ncbi:MAG: YggS family pyridoxal phosphate-dependent enzyme [Flavisolibacter sp.]|nr:YggS family pyridoxal phosphate-dependent enzyme [Flavisolibacter sp.]
MAVDKDKYLQIKEELSEKNITLVAVSKSKPITDILELYESGHRDFGENYVQELLEKQSHLPQDIRWHFIGHLQTNKVKFIAPFVHLIHVADSFKLCKEINKQGEKNNRSINVLLQVHIAQEETKFGLNEEELKQLMYQLEINRSSLQHISVQGLMGMASFTDDHEQVRKEFRFLKNLFDEYKQLQTTNCNLQTLSMGMSSDYKIAIEEGTTMVRIGSLLFGERRG